MDRKLNGVFPNGSLVLSVGKAPAYPRTLNAVYYSYITTSGQGPMEPLQSARALFADGAEKEVIVADSWGERDSFCWLRLTDG